MANEDIRRAVKENGIFQWQVAERLGIVESTLCRKLRHELSDTEKQRYFAIIDELAKEKSR